MGQRPWLRPIWFACLGLLACAQARSASCQESLPGDTQSAQLATEYIQLVLERANLNAELESAKQSAATGAQSVKLSAASVNSLSSIPGFDELPAASKEAFGSLLLAIVERFVQGLQPIEDFEKLAVGRQQEIWETTRTTRNNLEIQNAEIAANRATFGRLASLLSLDNRWFWLAALVAFGVVVAVSWHDRRHEYRRRLNGSKARALGVASLLRYAFAFLLVTTLFVFIFGGRLYDWLTRPPQGSEVVSASTKQEEIVKLKAECDGLRAELKKLSPQPATPAGQTNPTTVAARMKQQWQLSEERFQQLQLLLGKHQVIANGIKTDADKIALLIKDKSDTNQQIQQYRTQKAQIRAGMGFGLFFLAGGAAVLLLRGIRQRRDEISQTCPRCLGKQGFSIEGDPSSRGLRMLRCPEPECNFSFSPTYQELPKLCFPTLGHPQSGKTHWLAKTYWQLMQGNYDGKVQFTQLDAEGSEDWDRTVEGVVHHQISPDRTQTHAVPHPIVFNFQDRDPFGRSNVLLSIFDYSGEVMQGMTLDDPQRRRALSADGYLVFLDPTEPDAEQIKEIRRFRSDVEKVHNVKPGQTIHVPVAFCVSKIDKLLKHHGGDAVNRFYEELRRVDPTGQTMTLEVIAKRSALIQELRDTIWPGWQVERVVDELFGGRYMYFPMTPVGLSDISSDVSDDLRDRQVDAFAILEPLMWLLHMNGYPVLK